MHVTRKGEDRDQQVEQRPRYMIPEQFQDTLCTGGNIKLFVWEATILDNWRSQN